MSVYFKLLLFIGLAWGQPNKDLLILKSGESIRGTYSEKVNGQIIFYNYNHNFKLTNNSFPINDVKTIVTKDGEFNYPFDIPKTGIFGMGPKASSLFYLIGLSFVFSLAYLLAIAIGLPPPG
ncbi:MAG: hypothetical protein H8E56_00275 [Candidatus Marinimicrobia bacterium]|nr:hypothetical protein [Candidatus Neomarinimicrobiota bacterium]